MAARGWFGRGGAGAAGAGAAAGTSRARRGAGVAGKPNEPGPGRGRPPWQGAREAFERAVRWGYHAPGVLYDYPGPGQVNENDGSWFYPDFNKEAVLVRPSPPPYPPPAAPRAARFAAG